METGLLLMGLDTSAWGRHLFQILQLAFVKEEVEGQGEEQGLTRL